VTRAMVFLDFDGLICDTEQAAQQSWRDLYARHGLAFPPAVWLRMIGRSAGEQVAIADLADRLGRPLPAEQLGWRRRHKQRLADRQPLLPGVAALLGKARGLRIPVAVVSSSPLCWVHGHLARLGVQEQVAFLVTGEDALDHKPAPDLYVAALSRGGVPAGRTVALEDSPTGIAAARAAGVRCIAVAGTGPFAISREHLQAADLILDSVEQFDIEDVIVTEGA
jgi:HAD superfamily hydrolase (TIGR01509 family)